MSEWQRLFRRVSDLVSPPRYPEYQEYRDEPDAKNVGGAVPSAGSADDETIKMRRVQMVAALAVLLSIGGGAWLYFSGGTDEIAGDPRIREALASEVLKSGAGDPATGIAPPESLDNIKRWASDLERRMERGYDDTSPSIPAPSARPSAPYYGQGYDMDQPMALPDVGLSYGDSGGEGMYGSSPAFPANMPVPVEPGNAARPPAASAPAVSAVPLALPSSPAQGSRPDSPQNPYQRRSLEPVTYEPRNVDPY